MTKQSLSRWTVEDSRARRCKRWSLYPDDVVDLTVAEMDLPVAAPVMAAVRDAVEREAFGYPLPDHASGLPATAADWLGRQGLVVPAEQLRLLADVIKGIVLGLRWLTPPGSPVAVITPTYSRFADAVEAAERPLIEVPMLHGDDGYTLDVDAVDGALGAGARTVLLCSPSNPVGRVFSAAELTELSQVVEAHGARVLSDEIHAPVRYETEFVPYASIGDAAARHSMTFTSASKAWNVPGLRCALVALTNPSDVARWDAVPRAAKGGISPLGMEATEAAFRYGQPWLDDALAILDANRRDLVAHLDAAGLGDMVHVPEATYLAWLDLRRFDLPDPRRHLLESARVATTDGAEHGAAGAGFVRVNFASPHDIVLDASERIVGALKRRPAVNAR